MTTEEKILSILHSIENDISNMKELIRKDTGSFHCSEIVDMEIAVANFYKCVEGNKDE